MNRSTFCVSACMPILGVETPQNPPNLLSEIAISDASRRWWAVYTKPRQEKAFARSLVQWDMAFYLPLVPKSNRIRGKIVHSHIPLFGGYVFLFGNEAERVKSLTTNRIATVLHVEDQSQLTHDLHQIARLIACEAPLTVEKRIKAGDPVRIRSGPMEGMEGIVVSRRARTRLLVCVKMLQQGVSIEIDDFLLEPIH